VSVIELKSEKEYQSWAAVVAKGFDADELATGFLHYAAAPTIHCYAAQIDGQLAAGATMGVDQGIADFGVTSTLPSARGRGAQRALLQRRLRHAQTLGLDVAVVTTEAGSISDRNVQRAGFQVAYTRQKFERPLE
jgi:GNAT superfamily N-acetyltransferase